MTGNRASFPTSWVVRGLIFALIVANLLLVRQNFAMRRQLADWGKAGDATARSLKQGELVASVAGSDLEGKLYEVNYQKDERRHLLLYFSPACVYCVRQAPRWRELLEKVDSRRIEVMGIVSDKEDKNGVFAHVEELGYLKTKTPLPVLFVSNESLARYKLMATPTTLLIDDEGNVEHVWVGMWDEAKANEIAAALK